MEGGASTSPGVKAVFGCGPAWLLSVKAEGHRPRAASLKALACDAAGAWPNALRDNGVWGYWNWPSNELVC
jgi:hypothetical protein